MSSSAEHDLRLSFDGYSWQAIDGLGNTMPLPQAKDELLPELPDGYSVSTLTLPVEQLLSRSFLLPLAHPRFIDADILAQELDEKTGEKSEHWWLAWQAAKDEDGVGGLVFGLPERMRLQIDAEEPWQRVRHVGVDVWSRLQAQLSAYQDTGVADDRELGRPLAVFDADADGLFFGVWIDGEEVGSAGHWRGMRRLNQGRNMSTSEMAVQIQHSLLAMGWSQMDLATGRLSEEMLVDLSFEAWVGEAVKSGPDEPGLPGRHVANLSLSSVFGLDFRHGRWGARSGFSWLRPWRRVLNMAVAILLIWMLGNVWQIQRLESQAELYRQQITAAFHKGLPDESVMIDALAQLRRAVSNDEASFDSSADWLRQIDIINKVYSKTAWTIREFSAREGVMQMSGKAKDIATLTSIREALQQQSGRDVKLVDTDLSGDQVTFRMNW